ncbi:MAG: hypothetical protein ABIE74_05210 [Pseudomonadota bacterium]
MSQPLMILFAGVILFIIFEIFSISREKSFASILSGSFLTLFVVLSWNNWLSESMNRVTIFLGILIGLVLLSISVMKSDWKWRDLALLFISGIGLILSSSANSFFGFIAAIWSAGFGIAMLFDSDEQTRTEALNFMYAISLGVLLLVGGGLLFLKGSDSAGINFNKIGLIFASAGALVLMGIYPFGVWLNRITEETPNYILLLIYGGWRIALFGGIIRFLSPLLGLKGNFAIVLGLLALITTFIGSASIWNERKERRIIIHFNYALGGVFLLPIVALPGGGTDVEQMMLLLMTSLLFSIIGLFSLASSNMVGMWRRAIAILLMFSGAGIGPFFTFFAKLNLFSTLSAGGNIYPLVCSFLVSLMLIMSVVRFALKVDGIEHAVEDGTIGAKAVSYFSFAASLVFGILPSGMLAISWYSANS